MNRIVLNTALVVSTLTAGCTKSASIVSSPAAPPEVEPIASNPVIVELISRDETIIVSGSAIGLLYSIESGGRVQARDLSEKQLRTLHPKLYQRLNSSYAQDGSFDWAGLNAESLSGSE